MQEYNEYIENALDEADKEAEDPNTKYYTHEEVFGKIRRKINGEKYKIKYLPLFYNDLDQITDYIMYKLNNEIAANEFVNKLENEINKRAYNPDAYEKYIH